MSEVVFPGFQVQPGYTIVYDDGFPRTFKNFHICKNEKNKTFLTDLQNIFKVISTKQGPVAILVEGTKIGPKSEYTVIDIIGRGGYGNVYLVIDDDNNEWVIKVQRKSSGLVEEFYLKKVQGILNVCEIKECFVVKDSHFTVMKKYDGTLSSLTQISSFDWCIVLQKLLIALSKIHEKKITHCDIKPENIFLKNGDPIMGDFGIADKIGNKGGLIFSWFYRHPDLMERFQDFPDVESACKSNVFNRNAQYDIWALATTLFHVITRKVLFKDCGEYQKKFFFNDEKQMLDAINLQMETPGGISHLVLTEIKNINLSGKKHYQYVLISILNMMLNTQLNLSANDILKILNDLLSDEKENYNLNSIL